MPNELLMSNGLTLVPLIPGCLYKFQLEEQTPDLYRFIEWDYVKRNSMRPVEDKSRMIWIARFKDRKGITVLLDEYMVVGDASAKNLIQELGIMGHGS